MKTEFSFILEHIEKVLAEFLPAATNEEWQRLSFGALKPCVTDAHLKNLSAPCRNLMDLGGKRWRPLLLVLCAKLVRESRAATQPALTEEQTYAITPLVEFVHTASLIHDDIEDSADTRRGKPAAHITYGLDTALNAGSWLYFEALTCIDRLDANAQTKQKFYALYAQELRRLHLGQAMDIYWHRTPGLFPTTDEYTQMVHCKTGTLASLAAKAGFMAGGADDATIEKAGTIAAALGEGFQILDDVQNLTTGNPGKKRGDDIVEGKKSLPVLLHIQQTPRDVQKIAALFARAAQEGIDSPAVEECIALLHSKDAITQAMERGRQCIEQNCAALTNCFGTAQTASAATSINELFNGMILKFQGMAR